MQSSAVCRCAFTLSVTTALLAGCAGSQPPFGGLTSQNAVKFLGQPSSSSAYRVLYVFQGKTEGESDGEVPESSVIEVKNRFYGTTVSGGTLNYSLCGGTQFFAGCGTVFKMTAGGKESIVYRFTGGTDGFFPRAGLIALNGTLYGTTTGSGRPHCKETPGDCGTVFALSLSGQERVLHGFNGSPDGGGPSDDLIAVNGTLYGTTYHGGFARGQCGRVHGCGVVFAVTPSGTEHVVYKFRAGADGEHPSGPLFALRGALYGTTFEGGSGGCGTVFKVTTSGTESVVYSFAASSDSCNPVGGVVAVNGKLYGVTKYGGGNQCNCGSVFRVTTAGREEMLRGFAGGSDGYQPVAGLVAFAGALYGTTGQGGSRCGIEQTGCGTIFKITTSGLESILHAFNGGSDGAGPVAPLRAVRGVLYGTTVAGGAYNCGIYSSETCGTVFRVLP